MTILLQRLLEASRGKTAAQLRSEEIHTVETLPAMMQAFRDYVRLRKIQFCGPLAHKEPSKGLMAKKRALARGSIPQVRRALREGVRAMSAPPPDSPDSVADEIIAERIIPPTNEDAVLLVQAKCATKTTPFRAGVILALARRRRRYEAEQAELAKEPHKPNPNFGTWG